MDPGSSSPRNFYTSDFYNDLRNKYPSGFRREPVGEVRARESYHDGGGRDQQQGGTLPQSSSRSQPDLSSYQNLSAYQPPFNGYGNYSPAEQPTHSRAVPVVRQAARSPNTLYNQHSASLPRNVQYGTRSRSRNESPVVGRISATPSWHSLGVQPSANGGYPPRGAVAHPRGRSMGPPEEAARWSHGTASDAELMNFNEFQSPPAFSDPYYNTLNSDSSRKFARNPKLRASPAPTRNGLILQPAPVRPIPRIASNAATQTRPSLADNVPEKPNRERVAPPGSQGLSNGKARSSPSRVKNKAVETEPQPRLPGSNWRTSPSIPPLLPNKFTDVKKRGSSGSSENSDFQSSPQPLPRSGRQERAENTTLFGAGGKRSRSLTNLAMARDPINEDVPSDQDNDDAWSMSDMSTMSELAPKGRDNTLSHSSPHIDRLVSHLKTIPGVPNPQQSKAYRTNKEMSQALHTLRHVDKFRTESMLRKERRRNSDKGSDTHNKGVMERMSDDHYDTYSLTSIEENQLSPTNAVPEKSIMKPPKDKRSESALSNGLLLKLMEDGSQIIEIYRPGPGKPFGFYVFKGTINPAAAAANSPIQTDNSGKGSKQGLFISRLLDSHNFDGLLSIGDQILELNGAPIDGMTLDQIQDIIISSKDSIMLRTLPYMISATN